MALATSPVALAFQTQQVVRRRRLRRPPVWLHPRQIERSYARAFQLKTEEFIRQVKEVLLPALPAISAEADSELGLTRTDAWPDRVDKLLTTLRIGAAARATDVKALAIDVGQKTSRWNNKEWQKTLRKTVGVGLLSSEPGLSARLGLFATTDEKWFIGMQEAELNKLNGIIERGFSTGARHETVAKEIEASLGKTPQRARLTARDQVSKLNGRLTQMRQEDAGVSMYVWRDSDDTRVRTSHAAMDGKLCRWDDASVYSDDGGKTWKARSGIGGVELHPGQDILCRCFAEPYIQELAEEPASAPGRRERPQSDFARTQAKMLEEDSAKARARGISLKEFYRRQQAARRRARSAKRRRPAVSFESAIGEGSY